MRNRRSTFPELWLVSALPPPIHGVSAFNTALLHGLRARGIPHRVFRVGTRGALGGVDRFQAKKLLFDGITLGRLGASAALRAARAAERPVLYFTPAQGLGPMSGGGLTVLRDLAVARLGRAHGCRVVAHLHGCGWLNGDRGDRVARARLEVLRSCDLLIGLGAAYAAALSEATGVPAVGIDNGVPARPTASARRAPAPGERVELLFLSNLQRTKGLFLAAEALRALAGRGIGARLRCAGAWLLDADRADFLRAYAPELRAGSIELVGFAGAQEKERLLGGSHFLLLPSRARDEGQPLALIEAMADALPPITTPRGGIPDLLGPELAPLCSASHDDGEGIAASIVSLLDEPDRYTALSARCLARQREALTTDLCLGTVIRTLLSHAPR